MNLFSLIDNHIADLETRVSPATVRKVARVLRRFGEHAGDILITDLSRPQLLAYRQQRLGVISPSTVNYETGCVRRLTSWALEWGLLDTDPFAGVKLVKVKEKDRKRLRRPLTQQEVEDLLEAARQLDEEAGYRLVPQAPLLTAILGTGARRGEILATTWGDWDLDAARVRFRVTKSGQARVVPLPAAVVDAVASLQTSWEAVYGRRPGEDDPVFLSAIGRPYAATQNASHILRIFHAARERAGIPLVDSTGRQVDLHALRMSYASHAAEAGASPRAIQRLLGHASIVTTEQHYLRDGVEHLVEASTLLAARLGFGAASQVAQSREGESEGNLQVDGQVSDQCGRMISVPPVPVPEHPDNPPTSTGSSTTSRTAEE